MKENDFTLAKAKSRKYPARTITDAGIAADRALLANAPTQAKSLLHSLDNVEGGIGLDDDADKTEYMCFNQNQKGGISTQRWSLKLVNIFTYLGSNVSSTENDIKRRLAKAWKAIDKLSVI